LAKIDYFAPFLLGERRVSLKINKYLHFETKLLHPPKVEKELKVDKNYKLSSQYST